MEAVIGCCFHAEGHGLEACAEVPLSLLPCGETKLWALSNLRALPGVGFECLLERLPGVGRDRRSMRHQDELDR
jgi:hypothetical protein